MLKCPNCEAVIFYGAKQCSACGYSLQCEQKQTTSNTTESAKIIIERKSKMNGSLQSHDVFLYNTYIGELKNGETIEIPVDIGTYTLVFKSKMKKLGKDATFSVVVNEPAEKVKLKAEFVASGNFVVSYADNTPHFSNVRNNNNALTANNTTADEQPSGILCCRCGSSNLFPVSETTTKGKDFNVGDALCGAILLGPLGLLCGATGKGKQTTTTTYWLCKNCGNKFKA